MERQGRTRFKKASRGRRFFSHREKQTFYRSQKNNRERRGRARVSYQPIKGGFLSIAFPCFNSSFKDSIFSSRSKTSFSSSSQNILLTRNFASKSDSAAIMLFSFRNLLISASVRLFMSNAPKDWAMA